MVSQVKLYKQFALTIATATVFSGINSLSLTPALCALFLKPTKDPKFFLYKGFNKVYDKTLGAYVKAITYFLRKPVITMSLFLILSVGALWLFLTLAYIIYSSGRSRVFCRIRAAPECCKPATYRRGVPKNHENARFLS